MYQISLINKLYQGNRNKINVEFVILKIIIVYLFFF